MHESCGMDTDLAGYLNCSIPAASTLGGAAITTSPVSSPRSGWEQSSLGQLPDLRAQIRNIDQIQISATQIGES